MIRALVLAAAASCSAAPVVPTVALPVPGPSEAPADARHEELYDNTSIEEITGTLTDPMPNLTADPPVVRGKLPVETVSRLLQEGRSLLRACYVLARRRDPAVAGTLQVHLWINVGGEVSARIAGGTVEERPLRACIARMYRLQSFPAMGTPVEVRETLHLAPP